MRLPWPLQELLGPDPEREQELGEDFIRSFIAAWVLCAVIGVLSVLFAGRLFGSRFSSLPEKKKALWHCYSYCLPCGVISSSFLFRDLHELFYEHLLDPNYQFNGQPVRGMRGASGFSTGFLAFDLVVMILWRRKLVSAYRKPLYIQMVVHHTLSIMTWPLTLWHTRAQGYVAYCIMTEGTSLFLNVQWLMREAQLDNTTLYMVNGGCLVVSFFLARIAPMPWVFWCWWNAPKAGWLWSEYIYGAITVPMPPLLNLYWFSFLVRGIRDKLCPQRGRATSGGDSSQDDDGGAKNKKASNGSSSLKQH